MYFLDILQNASIRTSQISAILKKKRNNLAGGTEEPLSKNNKIL